MQSKCNQNPNTFIWNTISNLFPSFLLYYAYHCPIKQYIWTLFMALEIYGKEADNLEMQYLLRSWY